jgi:hypothetical protein
VSFYKFKYFISDVMDCRNDQRDGLFSRQSVDDFTDGALAANWVSGITEALIIEPARRAFMGLLTVRKPYNEKGIASDDQLLKCLNRS